MNHVFRAQCSVTSQQDTPVERIQKILSHAGVASRRAAERLMIEGRVSVNGTVIRELGSTADLAVDDIRVDDRRVKAVARPRYILLNKPTGYVTTRSDPQRRPTVLDLLGGVKEYVYPVGRLDFDSEGLLLLTNDGALAQQLTHPRHEVPRIYEVQVLGTPDPHDLRRLAKGVMLEGRRTQPATIEMVPAGRAPYPTLRLSVREGRNRQVRKMCEVIGHPVVHLRRVAIGPLRDERLKIGHWRELTPREVEMLRRASAPTPAPKASPAGRRK
jgi:pseudouridine synthase